MAPRDAYVARRAKWAKQVGPTDIVGPNCIGEKVGVIRPILQRNSNKALPLIKVMQFLFFFHVGLNVSLCLTRDVTTCETLD